MAVIWKYEVGPGGISGNLPPKGSTCLSVQMQHGAPVAWFYVPDRSAPVMEDNPLKVIGTGHEFEFDGEHDFIDTFQMGPLVWHVFEVKN